MSNGFGKKIVAFFGLAEAIATLIAIIPIIIQFYEFKNNPTDTEQLINFFEMIPWFLIGQIPGMIISAFVNGIFGRRSGYQ
jgi:hypothetical protein